MARILVVDDEEAYRRQLTIALTGEGHEVRVAASGREGIDVGTRFRPDLLLTDWMLRDDIHGLHVAHVLHAVLPEIRAFLMTGFLSDHLRHQADRARVMGIIEKPFTLESIHCLVRDACLPRSTPPRIPMLAMFEVDGRNQIRFANERARSMLVGTSAGVEATNLADVFTPDTLPELAATIDRWVPAVVRADEHRRWYLRSQEPLSDGSRLLVCRPHEEPRQWGLALIEMLLNIRDFQHSRWPLDGRALVLDAQTPSRNWFVSMFESVGAGCYAVVTPDEAIHLLRSDEGIEVLLIRHGDEHTLAQSVNLIRAARPDVVIVATDQEDRSEECRRLGVHHFLMEPWRIDNLIDAVAGRIGKCSDCGLVLPLRRARPGEAPTIWSCANCGRTYEAVIDEESPINTLANARAAEPN